MTNTKLTTPSMYPALARLCSSVPSAPSCLKANIKGALNVASTSHKLIKLPSPQIVGAAAMRTNDGLFYLWGLIVASRESELSFLEMVRNAHDLFHEQDIWMHARFMCFKMVPSLECSGAVFAGKRPFALASRTTDECK